MQTSYTQDPPIGIAGDWASSDPNSKAESYAAQGAIPVAIVVVRGTDKTRQVKQPAAPDAADDDAILASGFATAATRVVKTAADFDGVVGAGRLFPPRKPRVTLSSHADFNATELIISGKLHGLPVQDRIAIPDAGNVVIDGRVFFDEFEVFDLDPQGGTGGTIKVGFGPDLGPIDGRDVAGIAMRDTGKTSLTDHADKSVLAVARKGVLHVLCETTAVKGEPAYVRLVATGDEVRGAVRKDADGSAGAPDAVPVIGMTFDRTITAAGIVPIALDL